MLTASGESWLAAAAGRSAFRKGKKLLSGANGLVNNLAGGWKVSRIHNYQSGYPVFANVNPGVPVYNPSFTGDPNAALYINPAAFSRPPNYTFGSAGRALAYLRSPTLLSEDFSAGKNFFLGSERRYLEFRASAFNIFNRTQFRGLGQVVDNVAFGRISSQANRPREIQFSLRLSF